MRSLRSSKVILMRSSKKLGEFDVLKAYIDLRISRFGGGLQILSGVLRRISISVEPLEAFRELHA